MKGQCARVAALAVMAGLVAVSSPSAVSADPCVGVCDNSPVVYPFQGETGGGAVDFGDGHSGAQYPFEGSHDQGSPAPSLRQDPFGGTR